MGILTQQSDEVQIDKPPALRWAHSIPFPTWARHVAGLVVLSCVTQALELGLSTTPLWSCSRLLACWQASSLRFTYLEGGGARWGMEWGGLRGLR